MNAPARTPGRPRDPATDRAILDATVTLLCEQGYEAVTIDAVASLAGVSRPTVYRRHQDRVDLVCAAAQDAFVRLMPPVAAAHSPGERVLKLLDNTVAMLTETAIGEMFRAVIPHLPRHPRLAAVANQLGKQRRAQLTEALEQARRTGEYPDGRDLDAVIDGVLGAVYFRFFITGRSLDRDYVHELLRTLA